MIHVVDHHHRRTRAGRETLLFLLEEDAPVRRALAELDAELALGVRNEVVRAVQQQLMLVQMLT